MSGLPRRSARATGWRLARGFLDLPSSGKGSLGLCAGREQHRTLRLCAGMDASGILDLNLLCIVLFAISYRAVRRGICVRVAGWVPGGRPVPDFQLNSSAKWYTDGIFFLFNLLLPTA